MLIFKDAFSDDELASDNYDNYSAFIVDDFLYEIKCNYVHQHGALYHQIVTTPGLQEKTCYKNQGMFKSYVKSFMKKVIEHMEKSGKSADEVNQFKTKIDDWILDLLKKGRFEHLAFFVGENMAEGRGEGQVAIVEYRDEGVGRVPYMMLVKEGIKFKMGLNEFGNPPEMPRPGSHRRLVSKYSTNRKCKYCPAEKLKNQLHPIRSVKTECEKCEKICCAKCLLRHMCPKDY